MSRLLYQAELHRRDDRAARSRDRTGRSLYCQSPFTESNRRPSPYHGDALPTELKGLAVALAARRTLQQGRLGMEIGGALQCTKVSTVSSRAPLTCTVRARSHASKRSSDSGREIR